MNVSEKKRCVHTNEWTNARTDERTDATPKVSTTSWSRDQQARDAGSLDLSCLTLNVWFLKGLKGIRGD